MLGLDRLKATLWALTQPGAVEIAWKSGAALSVASAAMVGVAIYMPPAPPFLDFGVGLCVEDAAGRCQTLGEATAVADAVLDATAIGQTEYGVSAARIDYVWAQVGAAKHGPGAARGGESVRLRCSETLSLAPDLGSLKQVPMPGDVAACPTGARGRPLHTLSIAMIGSNHYRFRMTCGFADGRALIVEDGAICKSANRQPLTSIKLALRQNYFSILQDASCRFAGFGCAPGIETGRFGPNRKIDPTQ